jgi:CheY-like chemotaxis protein
MTAVRRIIIADDDPAIRTLLRTSLERKGHTVREAGSAAHLFEAIDAQRPDVVLLDVHFGADDGLAIGVGLLQDRRHKGIKIIFMTGTVDDAELARLSVQWGTPILGKPFDLDDLSKAVLAP